MNLADKLQTPRRFNQPMPVVGVGLVILLNGKLLLVRRQHEPAKDQWTLPGGVVEWGESLVEAAKREAKEETGLDVKLDSIMDVVELIERDDQGNPTHHYVLIDYLAYAVAGKLQAGSDAAEIRTVDQKEWQTLPLSELTRRFIEKHQHQIFGTE